MMEAFRIFYCPDNIDDAGAAGVNIVRLLLTGNDRQQYRLSDDLVVLVIS